MRIYTGPPSKPGGFMFARNTFANLYSLSRSVESIKGLSPRRVVIFTLILTFVLPAFSMRTRQRDLSPSALDGAFSHLAAEMDRYHKAFDVYTDANAAGNHFSHYAKIADDFSAVGLDLCSTQEAHSGKTAIKSTFQNTTSQNWGGWYALNGILTGQDTSPRANFGETPNAGIDLRGATEVSFWAIGKQGGEKVEFFMGGVGRNPENGAPVMPFPDSTPRIPDIGTTVTLSTTWTKYSIDLTGKDLSYILGGFAWVCAALDNPNGAVFWIDDIQYNKSRLDEPRFIRSYVTLSSNDFDTSNRDVAFSSDNAVAMLALIARGQEDDWRRAKLIADAFVYAQANDPTYNDGRVRNAYEAGDVRLPPGWSPNGKTQAARLPIIADCAAGTFNLDRLQIGSHTGNVALVTIALLTYFQKMGGIEYLEAARQMGEWIEDRRETSGLGGYRGGFEGFDRPSALHPRDPVEVPWANTEQNMMVFAAFTKLFAVTGESIWQNRAAHAQQFVEAMWDSNRGCFFLGTKDVDTIERNVLLLGVQSLSILTQPGASGTFSSALVCAEARHQTEKDGLNGFDFSDDRDGIWLEGTARMSLAYAKSGKAGKADEILTQLRLAQKSAQNANEMGIVAASHDGITTGLVQEDSGQPLLLFNRLHIGATGWYAFAELKANPFYLFDSNAPKITVVSTSGKKLIVTGENFAAGAVILLNGNRQKTVNDAQSPDMKLIGKKAGKEIRAGDRIKVRNPDGSESKEIIYSP